MKVLQVYRDHFSDLPGGIERHVDDLAQGLKTDLDVEILASARSRRTRNFVDRGVPVRLVPEYGRLKGIPLAPGFLRGMRRGHDIVHLHAPNPTAELAFVAGRMPAVGVLTYHSDLFKPRALFPAYRRLLSAVMARCARVVVSSEQLAATSPLVSAFRAKRPDGVAVVPFGVDTDRFSPRPTPGSQGLRAIWDRRTGGAPVVLFVGRLRYYKGLPDLIEALKDREAACVVVGDGLERLAIERMGEEVLGDRFILIPGVEDELLPDIYRAGDVFCLPSTSAAETFGLSLVEALASGLPAVTTEVGTATSVVNVHGRTGSVVPPRDPRALGDALESILSSETTRAAMSEEARERATADYGHRAMIRATIRLYEEALSR